MNTDFRPQLTSFTYMVGLVIVGLYTAVYLTGFRSIEVSYSWDILKLVQETSSSWVRDGRIANIKVTPQLFSDLFVLSNYLPLNPRHLFALFWFTSLLFLFDSVLRLSQKSTGITSRDLLTLFFVLVFPSPVWIGESLIPSEFSPEAFSLCSCVYLAHLIKERKTIPATALFCCSIYFGAVPALVAATVVFSLIYVNSSKWGISTLLMPGIFISLIFFFVSIYLETPLAASISDSPDLRLAWLQKLRGIILLSTCLTGLLLLSVKAPLAEGYCKLRPAVTLLLIGITLAVTSIVTPLPEFSERMLTLATRLGLIFAAMSFADYLNECEASWKEYFNSLLVAHLLLLAMADSIVNMATILMLLALLSFVLKRMEQKVSPRWVEFSSFLALPMFIFFYVASINLSFNPPLQKYTSVRSDPCFEWIKANTNTWSLFLIPPDLWQFQFRTGRSSFAEFPIDRSFEDETVTSQKSRLEKVLKIKFPEETPLAAGEMRRVLGLIYSNLTPSDQREVMLENGIDYLILYSKFLDIKKFQGAGFELLYKDRWLSVLKLSPGSKLLHDDKQIL